MPTFGINQNPTPVNGNQNGGGGQYGITVYDNPGTILDQVTDPSNPANAIKQGSCLCRYDLLSRKQYRSYIGKPVVGTGGFPYVISDTVPFDRYWVLLAASGIIGNSAQKIVGPLNLYVIPSGVTLPQIAAGSTPDDSFFLDYAAFPARAFGPPSRGLRIDDQPFTGTLASGNQGTDFPMIRGERFKLIGPGETLMVQEDYQYTPANPGALVEMRIMFAELLSSEDFRDF